MIKRTLYFGNPAYLSTRNDQLLVDLPPALDGEGKEVPGSGASHSAPIEDIGVLILDHQQITISQALIARLLANNVALITCNNTHHPTGLLLNLDGHTLQSQRYKAQLEATEPLKKQLWQQTVAAKVQNQAAVLGSYTGSPGELAFAARPEKYLLSMARDVKSGDSDNTEARAAAYYWRNMGPALGDAAFTRDPDGAAPNNLLNYGYALLRAVTARSLVGSGLLPTLGIFHRNQYNAYCLADDIMEPYRPYVDRVVAGLVAAHKAETAALIITPALKKQLLGIPAITVTLDDEKCPLMNAMQRTTASLVRCFEGKARKLQYPDMIA
jgi:CRISPR-associated protein Cas1